MQRLLPRHRDKRDTASEVPGYHQVSFLTAEEALKTPKLLRAWVGMLEGVDRLNRLYASPAWFEHLWLSSSGSELSLGLLQDGMGGLVGICPIALRRIALEFDIASRVLARSSMRAAYILGGEPLLPRSPEAHRLFLDGLFDHFPSIQSIYINSLPLDGYLGGLLGEGNQGECLVYMPDGSRPWHWIELGESFEAYLRAMNSKARYTLRKRVRELREHGGGDLDLHLVNAEDQVGEFFEQAAYVSQRSWQHRVIGQRIATKGAHEAGLRDLARRGILRGYLLKCGNDPCAFLIGYQADGVYHYAETGYNEAVGHLSPGTVLLYLVLEDLFRDDSPSAFNFGVGDGVHKRRFANRETRDASAFLLRDNLANRFRRGSHRAFYSGVRLAKRLLCRRVTK